MDTQYAPFLKRVGGVLLVVGLIDIAAMIYCIANRMSYSSSFNIFAVVAGILLIRGSLRTASIVRWFALFMLSAFVALLVVLPFMQPASLMLTQLRLSPGTSFAIAAVMVFVLSLLFWVEKELGHQPVQAACASAGLKQRDMRIPVAVGVGLVVVMGVFIVFLLEGESAGRAKSLAAQKVGPGYHLHVSSLSIAMNDRGTSFSGVVTAWNDNEIRNIPVHWEER